MAYIPTTPPPTLPAPTSSPATPWWLGPTNPFGILTGLASGVAGSVVTGIAASRAGLRGSALQAPIFRSTVLGLATALPGLNLIGGIAALAKLAIGETLPEFQRREAVENPAYLGTYPNLSALDRLIAENPEDWARIQRNWAAVEAQNEARRLRSRVGIDPRTGAGVSYQALERELNVEQRLQEIRRVDAAQRVRFLGVPSIFTRRRL